MTIYMYVVFLITECLFGLVDNVYKKYYEIVKVNSPSAISAGTEKKITGSERNIEK